MPASFVVTFCRRRRTMCFSRRVRLLLIVIATGVLVSAETRKPIYRIRRYCKATSEYSPIRSIGLTLLNSNHNIYVHNCSAGTQNVSIHRETFPKQHSFQFLTEGDQSRRIPDTSRQRVPCSCCSRREGASPSVERRVDGTSSVDVSADRR